MAPHPYVGRYPENVVSVPVADGEKVTPAVRSIISAIVIPASTPVHASSPRHPEVGTDTVDATITLSSSFSGPLVSSRAICVDTIISRAIEIVRTSLPSMGVTGSDLTMLEI